MDSSLCADRVPPPTEPDRATPQESRKDQQRGSRDLVRPDAGSLRTLALCATADEEARVLRSTCYVEDE